LARSFQEGIEASFPSSDLVTLGEAWLLAACPTFTRLKGDDLLLPKIPKTEDEVHSVTTGRQQEEVLVLKEVDHIRERGRVVHESEGVAGTSQRALELHGFFEESLRSFFLGEVELLPGGAPRTDGHAIGHLSYKD
jgi:hypothetical protein